MNPARAGYIVVALMLASLIGCGGGGGSTSIPPPIVTGRTSIRLQSDAGDWAGQGGTYTYSQADSQIVVNSSGGHFGIEIHGDESWWGDFQLPSDLSQLTTGSYTIGARYPFNDPSTAGMSWSGMGGCNTLSGSFVIDKASYSAGKLAAIDLHFEQHCENQPPALHGELHWDAADKTAPPGPLPIPKLWQPPKNSTPSTGAYIYLQSDPLDYAGRGQQHLYTQHNARVCVTVFGGPDVDFGIADDFNALTWSGSFHGINGKLTPGYYNNLDWKTRFNPVKAAFGFGLPPLTALDPCTDKSGWFVVDRIDPNAADGSMIDIRFEQHCNGAPALRGKIHWPVNCGPWQYGTPIRANVHH